MELKRNLPRRVGMGALALLMAVALTLPNYARAVDADRIQSEALRTLYETYLADLGAQEAYAFAPVVALPAAIAAAGITPEMAGAACLAIFTAVTAVSVSDVWDKMPTDQKARYDGSLANFGLAMGMVSGNYTFDPDDPDQPPEPKGPGGDKMNAAIIALCSGAGLVALKDLTDAAGYLIDFVTNPFGEDANGLPTGLGVLNSPVQHYAFGDYPLMMGDHAAPDMDMGPRREGCYFDCAGYRVYLCYSYRYVNLKFQLGLDNRFLTYPAYWYVYKGTDIVAEADGSGVLPAVFAGLLGTKASSGTWQSVECDLTDLLASGLFLSSNLEHMGKASTPWEIVNSQTGVTSKYDVASGTWVGEVFNDLQIMNQVINAPSEIANLMQQIAQAGPGTEASQQIINNYVTNNIANSDKSVVVPSDLADTGDYDKVVVDGKVDPDPGPDPDPGADETAKDKAEKFLKLPVQQLFPFCLVYDIQLLIEHVAGGAVMEVDDSLVFEFDVGFGYFNAPLVIDLTDYRDMQGAFHLFFDVMMVVGLLYFSISLFLKARSD